MSNVLVVQFYYRKRTQMCLYHRIGKRIIIHSCHWQEIFVSDFKFKNVGTAYLLSHDIYIIPTFNSLIVGHN